VPQRSSYIWPSLGPALGLAAWSFALLAARSVFGDLPVSGHAQSPAIVASVDSSFRAYLILSALALIAAVLIAIYYWRAARAWAIATIVVVSTLVVAIAGVAFYGS